MSGFIDDLFGKSKPNQLSNNTRISASAVAGGCTDVDSAEFCVTLKQTNDIVSAEALREEDHHLDHYII